MRRLLLIPMLATLAVIASLSIVSVNAHSRPIRFDPAPGTILNAPPAEITGWFTSDIRRADESFIRVTDVDGAEVQTGDVELSSDRRQMTTALQPDVDDGRYVVYWSTFDDADGEVFGGCYTFFVGEAAAADAIAAGVAMDGGADCPVQDEGHSHDHEVDPNAASIQISIPETVQGNTATLEITPTNFTPRAPSGNATDPNFGHYHIYLDNVPVDILTGEHSHEEGEDHGTTGGTLGSLNPGSLPENPMMWVENNYTFTNLEPGYHTVAVALNHDDHSPFSPPVVVGQTFFVEGGSADGGSYGGIPTWALVLGVIGGLVVGGLGMKLAGSRA